jgi:alpha-galactosidase
MAASRLKIVIVGGGSNAWAPQLIRDIIITPSLTGRCDFVLLDVIKSRAELVQAFARKLAGELGVKARFTATDRQAAALRGADYIIIAISTGGLDAMKHDLAIPEKFGVFHTVGDTVGPGGWARAIRNFQIFHDLGRDIARLAPQAVVLNYTNPMTCLTDVLCRVCDNPVVGLCHGLFENLQFIKSYYQLESEDQISVQYAGVNHFFWITHCFAGKVDVLADLKRKLGDKGSLSTLLKQVYEDPMGHRSDRELATELFRQTGVLPYLGDRHTCECFSSYITNRQTMKKYKLVRTSIQERKEKFQQRGRELQQHVRDDRLPDFYRKRGRETAADIINAHAHGQAFIDVGNVPNLGQIANLPRGLVVETAVRVDRNGFTPLTFGNLPPQVLGLVQPFGLVFPMTIDACFRGDLKLAVQALRLDPLCLHLTFAQVQTMAQRLLSAHRRFIRCF